MIRNKLLRAKVLDRDSGICAKCGRYDPKWQADHIVDLQFYGRDALDNLQTLCRIHHAEKTVAAAPIRAKADRLRERSELTAKRRGITGKP
jgi:5-methylcytosine-specific restriction endonuclease McrA